MKIKEEWKQENGLYKCPYCNELKTKNGICGHIIRKHIKHDDTIDRLNKARNKVNYNNNATIKGKMCISKDNIVKYIERNQLDCYISQGWIKGNLKTKGRIPSNKGKKLSEEQCKKISQCMKEVAKRRVYQAAVGRGHNGWYKGFWCDSSWELAYVIYCLDHDINITRNNKGFQYIFENEEHTYYPDFYNNDENCYIEIKGFENNKDREKIKQFKENIKVYYYKDMKFIFEYVKNKYGDNFVGLYDDREYENKREILIDKIKNSNVDFTKEGWIKKLRNEVNYRKIEHFMKKYMRDFYEKYYQYNEHKNKNNSQYNTYWITNGIDNMKWKDDKGDIPEGYYKGRVIHY